MATSVARCSSCRHSLLSAFVATAGLSVRPFARAHARVPRDVVRITTQRQLSVRTSLHSDRIQQVSDERPIPAEESSIQQTGEVEPAEEEDLYDGLQDDPSSQEVTSVPWYLQVKPPEREASPLLKRQQLPPLPPDPPPLLNPMLEHISTDLGLDDLTLFDLRDIDPPPALGANLIMVLGTARSEKHLHVSADRFCRWLKTTHKLSPYADGLLGRGELKLKLRRKARRAKLLSNVGSSEKANVDDGIRTGWICVNVGSIPDGREVMVHKDLHEDYVGFGEEVDGAKVVIQMLTQGKRDELDLEDLWGKMVRRHERKEARISPDAGQQTAREVGPEPQYSTHGASDSGLRLASLVRPSHGPTDQLRCYHTAIERNSAAQMNEVDLVYGSLQNDQTQSGRDLDRCFAGKTSFSTQIASSDKRLSDLKEKVHQLKSMSDEEARKLLSDVASPFWTSFNKVYPLFPTVHESELRLQVLCFAYEPQASSDKKAIFQMLHEIEATFIDIPDTAYMTALRGILRPPVSQSDLFEAALALERMSARGCNIATEEIRRLFLSAVLRVQKEPSQLEFREDAFQQLKRLMNSLLGQASVEAELDMMHACANAGKWVEFWEVWRGFPRAFRPRPKELYLAMFRCTARRGHQAEAMRCLRECIPEMALEQPPVAIDAEVAKAIKACLFVAEPDVARIAAKEDAFGEWASLWRRCNRAIVDTTAKN